MLSGDEAERFFSKSSGPIADPTGIDTYLSALRAPGNRDHADGRLSVLL
jgi:hypothetical protein